MASFNFFLDKITDPSLPAEETKAIVKECRAKKIAYPSNILNPKRTSVYLIANLNKGTQFKMKTRFKISPRDWNFSKAKVKASYGPEYIELNLLLDAQKNEIEKVYHQLVQNHEVTLRDVKASFSSILDGKKLKNQDSIKEGFERFKVIQSAVLSSGTLKEYNTVFKSWFEFSRIKKADFTFEDISILLLEEFELFLLGKVNENNPKKGILNDTIAKYISTFKAFMQWALERDLHKNTSFSFYKSKFKRKTKNEIVTLNKEELLSLYNYDFSKNPRLERVRDLFCFACFTGQRWSDVVSFRKKDLQGDTWQFYAQKTNKLTTIPLVGFSSRAMDILIKYNYVLPNITSQKANIYLKEVGEIVEISSPVKILRFSGKKKIEIIKPKSEFMSFHMARRTFVTLLLEGKVPITNIQKLTNHSDIRTLMKYENTGDEAARESIESYTI